MLQWSALCSRKNSTIKYSTHQFDFSFRSFVSHRIFKILAHHDHSASWSAKCFMCCSCNNVTIRKRIIQQTTCDQSGRMCNICHKQCANFVSNFSHSDKIPVTRIRRSTCNYQFRFFFSCSNFHCIIVYLTGFLTNTIECWAIKFARKVYR
ncbi:MAG: hypothetical protein BWY67_02287 [Bacteroidetes bacterium ADurb.Bin397]|nr:MAG: hypothetical protein BWY67_02287 [Bacteroidetes bacterium ADurb.Bin397]